MDYDYTARNETAAVTRYSDLAGTTVVATTNTTYDGGGRVTNIQTVNGASTVLANYTYTYDTADRITSKIENGTTTAYNYDATNQLTQDGASNFSYDGTGNRTMAGYSTGGGNRTSTDGVWTYTYDAEGNITKKSKGASAETWTYSYDFNNQLIGATDSATDGGTVTQRTTYAYDAFGNRIERQGWDGTTATTQRYALDGWDTALPTPLGNENFNAWADLDGGNALTDRHVFGNSVGAPVARETAGGVISWNAQDLQGSVRLGLNNSGTITGTLAYDAFGKIVVGTLADRFTYAAMQSDVVTGLMSAANGERELNPATGEWQQEDAVGFRGGDPDLRRYVANNPVSAVDSSGHQDRGPMQTLPFKGIPSGVDPTQRLPFTGIPTGADPIQRLPYRNPEPDSFYVPDDDDSDTGDEEMPSSGSWGGFDIALGIVRGVSEAATKPPVPDALISRPYDHFLAQPKYPQGLSLDDLIRLEGQQVRDNIRRLFNETFTVPRTDDMMLYHHGLLEGFIEDGVMGTISLVGGIARFWGGLIVNPIQTVTRIRERVESAIAAVRNPIARELAGYFYNLSNGRDRYSELSEEAKEALKYVQYFMLRIGNQVLEDPYLQGRIVGAITYEVVEGLLTAGAAKIGLPAKLAKIAEKLGVVVPRTGSRFAELAAELRRLGSHVDDFGPISRRPLSLDHIDPTVRGWSGSLHRIPEPGTPPRNRGHLHFNENPGLGVPNLPKTGSEIMDSVGPLTGKSAAEIDAQLTGAGFTKVTGNNGGTIYTKPGSDGTTAAVRIDPPKVRKKPKGYADEMPHIHKETVPTDRVTGGNYGQADATKLNDLGIPSIDERQTHIPGGH